MARGRPVDGRQGEHDAVRFLKKQGYRIVARNFACPLGEIDIIALRDGTLIFVEVKARAGTKANPEEAVNPIKQSRIGRIAEYFIRTHKLTHHSCRFDVIAINYSDCGDVHIEHFPDAFEPA